MVITVEEFCMKCDKDTLFTFNGECWICESCRETDTNKYNIFEDPYIEEWSNIDQIWIMGRSHEMFRLMERKI